MDVRRVAVGGADGRKRQVAYDDYGLVAANTDRNGNEYRFDYDYDEVGHLVTITDPLNAVTRMFYDEVGNMYLKIDAEGNKTRYEHDNVVKITDAEGNISFFIYDGEDKLIRKTDGEGHQVLYEYDQFGRLRKTIDGNLNEILHDFDDTVNASCFSCAGGGGTHQPIQITYPTCTKEFKYDKRQRKVFEKEKLSDSEAYFTWFEYDDAGNLISRTDREGRVTRYQYDALNRLINMTDAVNGETQYAYDGRNNLVTLTDAEGQTTTFEYDLNNRLVKETRPMGQTIAYAYDPAGHLIEKIDPLDQKTDYVYADAGRLVETRYFTASDHVTPAKTVSYAYDKICNLALYDDGVTSVQYVFDCANRKIAETIDYGAFELTNNFSYFKNGLRASLVR